MVDWHYKHLDTLTSISKRYAADAALPESSRELFLRSYDLAGTLKHFNRTEPGEGLARAFSAMCNACKDSMPHQCDPTDASFHRCKLVLANSS